jgi:hypothetical protein
MAWRIADDELAERQAAEEWLKREDPFAFQLRDEVMRQYGIHAYMYIHLYLFILFICIFICICTYIQVIQPLPSDQREMPHGCSMVL